MKKLEPDVLEFNLVDLGDDNHVYIGMTADKKKVLARRVFKDVLCDVCTNVHYVYSFDMQGMIRNISLIESIDLYGVQIDADKYLDRVTDKAQKRLPLRIRKDIDFITGATQSCKLILEGINETEKVLQSIKAYQNILTDTQ